MFVTDMLCDWRQGEGKIPTPAWEIIAAAVRELDAERRTEVSLGTAGEAHLSVSGGRGRYLVSATLDNDRFYDLANPAGDDSEPHRFVAAGQAILATGDEIVSLDVALTAARTFAETGRIDPTLSWIANPPLPNS